MTKDKYPHEEFNLDATWPLQELKRINDELYKRSSALCTHCLSVYEEFSWGKYNTPCPICKSHLTWINK